MLQGWKRAGYTSRLLPPGKLISQLVGYSRNMLGHHRQKTVVAHLQRQLLADDL